MTEQLFNDFKDTLCEKLNEQELLEPGMVRELYFKESIQNRLGFQRIFFSDNRELLHLNCEKTTLARELFSRLSVDGAERLVKRGWSIKTDFMIRGTGQPPVWPKNSRLLAHTRLEREQKQSGLYEHSLPPATRKFIEFWVKACKEGLIHNYSDDHEFARFIRTIESEGFIDSTDCNDLQAKIAEGKSNGRTYKKGLNPVPIFSLSFQVPALDSRHDPKTVVDLVLDEIWFLFDTLGLRDEYEERQMNAPTEFNSRGSALTDTCERVLKDFKRQIILQGPPGTGKTRLAKDVAELILRGNVSSDKESQREFLNARADYKIVQFHPSYTYEDFVRGIEVKTDDRDSAQYVAVDRILARFAKDASDSVEKKPHVLVIDEINRANISAVLGELIYALEYRGHAVDSVYGIKVKDPSDTGSDTRYDHQLILPNNLYIIGTMNTADRSASHLDYAIRRRFAFIDVLPEPLSQTDGFDHALFKSVRTLFTVDERYTRRSVYLSEEFRPRDVALGHSYFTGLTDTASRKFRLEYEIKPILFEYLKDGVLKESAREIIEELA